MIPQLLRTHFIHSLNKSGYSCLEIEGGLALTGLNGNGKTSFAVPSLLFYGCTMEDIKRATGGKDPIPHYFPYQESWVIHEYSRETASPAGENAMAAFYNANNGIGVLLIKAAFDQSFFLRQDEDGGCRSRNISELCNHLDQIGISTSPRLTNLADYRAIIFGADFGLSKRHSDAFRVISRYQPIFSIVPISQKPMLRLHKVAAALISTDRSDFRPMVHLIADELKARVAGDFQLRLIDPDVSEKLQGHRELYRRILVVENLFNKYIKLKAATEEIIDARESIASIYAAATMKLSNVEDKLSEKAAEIQSQQALFLTEKTKYDGAYLIENTKITDKTRRIALEESEVASFFAELKSCESKCNDLPSSEMERLPELRRNKRDLERLLDQDHDAINLTAEINAARDKRDYSIETSEKRRAVALKEANAEHEHRLEALDREFKGLQLEMSVCHQEKLANYQKLINEATLKIEHLRAESFSDEHSQRLLAKQALLKDTRNKLREANEAAKLKRQYIAKLKDDRSNLLSARDRLSKGRELAIASFERAKNAMMPTDGSVHSHLNKSHIGWQYSIGKVIRLDLLNESSDRLVVADDTKNKVLDDQVSIDGLIIDTNNLSMPDSINPDLVQSNYDAANEQVLLFASELEKHEAELEAINSKITQIESRELVDIEKIIKKLDAEIDKLDDEIIRINNQRNDYALKINSEIDAVSQARNDAINRKDVEHTEYSVRLDELNKTFSSSKRSCQIDHNAAIAILNSDYDAVLSSYREEYLGLKQSLESKISERGQQLRADLDAVMQKLDRLESLQASVKQRDLMLKQLHDFQRRADALVPAKSALQEMKSERAKRTSMWADKERNHDLTLSSLRKEIAQLEASRSLLREFNKGLANNFPDFDSDSPDDIHCLMSASELCSTGEKLCGQFLINIKNCIEHLNDLDAEFSVGNNSISEWHSAARPIVNNATMNYLYVVSGEAVYGYFYTSVFSTIKEKLFSEVSNKLELALEAVERFKIAERKLNDLARTINAQARLLALPDKLRNLGIRLSINENVLTCNAPLKKLAEQVVGADQAHIVEALISLYESPQWQQSLRLEPYQWLSVSFFVEELGPDGWRYNVFDSGESLKLNSSNGLNAICKYMSYALIMRVTTQGRIAVPLVIDEAANLDSVNIGKLVSTLRENNIISVVACPSASSLVMTFVKHCYHVVRSSQNAAPRLEKIVARDVACSDVSVVNNASYGDQ